MYATLYNLLAPLSSLVIFNVGAAFLVTFISVELRGKGIPAWEQSLSGCAHYVGYGLGALYAGVLIRRVGYVRAYTAFAAVFGVIALAYGWAQAPWLWHVMRVASSYCVAGTFLCIESWLLMRAQSHTRGRVLALYTLGLYLAQGAGQFLRSLAIDFSNSLLPMTIVAVLAYVSIIPIVSTRTPPVQGVEPKGIGVWALFRITPLGMLGCLISGLTLGVMYTNLPVSVLDLGFTQEKAYWSVGFVILGGALFQYPLGRLSDFISRRTMIFGLSLASALMAFALMIPMQHCEVLFFAVLFLLGGFSFAIYPICISHACDFVRKDNSLSVASGLFVAYCLGAIAGPYLAPLMGNCAGPRGNFLYIALCCLALMLCAWYLPHKKHVS